MIRQAWLTLPSCFASSSTPTLLRMIFSSLIIVSSHRSDTQCLRSETTPTIVACGYRILAALGALARCYQYECRAIDLHLEPGAAILALIDFAEIAVAAEAVLEAGGAGDAIFRQCFTPVVPFLNQRIAHGKAMAADRGTTIGTDTDLRKTRDLAGEPLGLFANGAVRHDVFAEPDPEALIGRNLAAGHDDLEGPS